MRGKYLDVFKKITSPCSALVRVLGAGCRSIFCDDRISVVLQSSA